VRLRAARLEKVLKKWLGPPAPQLVIRLRGKGPLHLWVRWGRVNTCTESGLLSSSSAAEIKVSLRLGTGDTPRPMKPDFTRELFIHFRQVSKPYPRAGWAVLALVIFTTIAFSWGCAGFVAGQNSSNPPPPPTYSISGTISPASGGNGATVTLSGAASATITANSSGAYTFTGLANGTYTITPSHAGYTFSPASATVTVNGANVTSGTNFTANAVNNTYSISGTITPTAGGSGATVTLSGAASASTTANSSGAYSFSGLANGSYAVTPSNPGYTFSPTSQNATVNGANVTGINFTATAQTNTYSISGTITLSGSGLSGASVALSGPAAANATTNSSGNYSFSGLANGTFTVTPTDSGYTFTPVNQSVNINGANQTGVNFTASSNTVALSWVASTTTTVTSYNVYRSTTNGSGYALIGSVNAPTIAYTDSNVVSGTTYYYVTTAVANGMESAYSNQATAPIP